MRPFRIGPVTSPLLVLFVAACGHSTAPAPSAPPTTSPSARAATVNPANIKRVVREMPPDYEVTTATTTAASPRVTWSLKADTSDSRAAPAQCVTLADPGGGHDRSAQRVSGSGSGGIIDAVVVALPGPMDLPHDIVAMCGQWTMTAGHTKADVHLTGAPHVDGAETVGMVVDIKSSVESGTEIDSRAYTFAAYLGDYYAFTTLTTDPGSALPKLPPQFAADLLVKTVSMLRS